MLSSQQVQICWGGGGALCSGSSAKGLTWLCLHGDPRKCPRPLVSPVQSEASGKPHPLPSSLDSQV